MTILPISKKKILQQKRKKNSGARSRTWRLLGHWEVRIVLSFTGCLGKVIFENIFIRFLLPSAQAQCASRIFSSFPEHSTFPRTLSSSPLQKTSKSSGPHPKNSLSLFSVLMNFLNVWSLMVHEKRGQRKNYDGERLRELGDWGGRVGV